MILMQESDNNEQVLCIANLHTGYHESSYKPSLNVLKFPFAKA